jgi:hypothetical protein
MDGVPLPLSMRATTLWVVPMSAVTSPCVRPACVRAAISSRASSNSALARHRLGERRGWSAMRFQLPFVVWSASFYEHMQSMQRLPKGTPHQPAKYSSTRSEVQVATPVPKKSASSVHTGQPIVMAQAKTGQSFASRIAILWSARVLKPS